MALSTVHDKPALAEPPSTAAAAAASSISSSSAAVGEGTPPELVETDFLTQVLQIKNPRTATWLDDLITKAIGLGITVTRPPTALSVSAGPNVESSTAESSVTLETNHTRTASSESNATLGTALTSDDEHHQHDLINNILARKRSRSLTFSQYDKYLAQTNPNIAQPRFVVSPTGDPEKATTPSLFSISTRKSYLGIRSGLTKIRRKRKAPSAPESFLVCCSACREDFKPDQPLQKLPCGHSYCAKCLQIMIMQSCTDESKMPPRCCTQPIPGSTVKTILTREEQVVFLKAVVQYSTPWQSRVFCPNPNCGEFIPPKNKIEPKHPFQVVCRKCRTRVCIMCKRGAHALGQDCPYDWELDAVLKMGEKSGWRRCYKCKALVELNQGCAHITCRCKAQFCYICGAVWDQTVGCPNFCNGDEELERRRVEEEARLAALQAEEALKEEEAAKEAAEREEAERRTRESAEFQGLRQDQMKEMDRFRLFERRQKWLMWSRHAQQKLALVEKHTAAIDKMKERHAKTTANLEDRQVAAEYELRSTLETEQRNVRTRLRHMEAYCDGLGTNPNPGMPSRTVTERDLRELGQQYNVEKNMKQLHQAKINVMRDRQAKALEELVDRQDTELERLLDKNEKEVESLESQFADEEDMLAATFQRRKAAVEKRWELCMEILKKELEIREKQRYSVMAPLVWPKEALEEGLSAVEE